MVPFVFFLRRVVLLFLIAASEFSSSCYALSSSTQRRTFFPNSRPVTKDDLKSMERQTGQKSPCEAAIGVPSTCSCRHGFPQVFAMNPMPTTGRMNSGLVKLTCPLLVNALDALEDKGHIQNLSAELENRPNWQEQVKNTHVKHADVRKELVTDAQREVLRNKLGDRASSSFMESGVAGSTPDSLDVKCLHAWFGDFLFCSREEQQQSSPFGREIRNLLIESGTDITGTLTCHAKCDPTSISVASPPNPRNKQRLKTRKEIARRKRKKEIRDQEKT